MKITPTTPITLKEVTPNSYTVNFQTMTGDADAFQENIIEGFKVGEDDKLLENLLQLFTAMLTAFPQGRGGGHKESYANHTERFSDWFNTDNNPSPTVTEFMKKTSNWEQIEWPTEGNFDSMFHNEQELTKFSVTYYDSDSVPYKTTIEL